MSRLGKVPVAIPSGVKLATEKGRFTVTGPKGSLKFVLHDALALEVSGAVARVKRSGETREAKTHHGLTRAMLANMVRGVSEGYERRLEINGVGWGAKVEGKEVVVTIGFCNPVRVPIPASVTVECPQPVVVIVSGIDSQQVGQLASKIRKIRPPEPYNAKGIKYSDETIKRKQGKSFGTT